jgi:Na+-translocating ferredoxin:NAD+ oxidoreductase RnfC subunit
MVDFFMREVWKSIVLGFKVIYWIFKFAMVAIARAKNRQR